MSDKKAKLFVAGCPGAADIKRPKPLVQPCPKCGADVEVWTDEVKTTCEVCAGVVYRKDLPSCFQWCNFAEECLGTEKYKQLTEADRESQRKQQVKE